jgi:hypothetical protein
VIGMISFTRRASQPATPCDRRACGDPARARPDRPARGTWTRSPGGSATKGRRRASRRCARRCDHRHRALPLGGAPDSRTVACRPLLPARGSSRTGERRPARRRRQWPRTRRRAPPRGPPPCPRQSGVAVVFGWKSVELLGAREAHWHTARR